ncbi:MAG: hypothetical protein KKH83_02475 [Candidatus Margulisbacteria bacterium]|nr:hypothetical protein [Candidatus Margulisiibacteriota bacterium]
MPDNLQQKLDDLNKKLASRVKEAKMLFEGLQQKKSEVENLFLGKDKYRDKPDIAAQMAGLIKEKKAEIEKIMARLKKIGQEGALVKKKMDEIYHEMREMGKKSKVIEALKAAKPFNIENMLKKAEKQQEILKEWQTKDKTGPQPEPMPKPAPSSAEGSAPSSKKTTLRDKAMQEQKAQQEFLRKMSKGKRDFGAA